MPDLDLPSIAKVLQSHGLRTQKKFGQHFLFDLNLTEKIVRLAGISADDFVFEIGPGPGGLTRPLLATGAKVFAIETDSRFEPILQQLHDHFENRLSWVLDDALKINLDLLADGKPYQIVANLPYNVGTALLINWLTAAQPNWTALTLMFQLEVAQRIVARPTDAHYGRLSILTAAMAEANLIMKVPASAFTPPPKVESAVVHLTPLPKTKRFDDLDTLARLTGLAFGQKRKMLRASLKPLNEELGEDISIWLQNIGIDPKARPETLSPNEFMKMANQLRAKL